MLIDRRTFLAGALLLPVFQQTHSTAAQTPAWTPLAGSASIPGARWDHHLIADPQSQRLWLFGGRDAAGIALGDLWVYDIAGETWVLSEAASPAPRFGSASATASDGSGAYLFGGQSDIFFNDLWWLDFSTGSWWLLDDGASVAPTPRYGLGGAIDDMNRFVISHGFTFDGRFDDTWAFDPASGGWVDVSPVDRPLRRCLHEIARTPEANKLVLYAGCSSGFGPCPQGDTWLFDTGTGLWTDVTPAVSPPARSNPALIDTGDRLVMMGGLTESGPAADVWIGRIEGDRFTWAALSGAADAIEGRSSHDMTVVGDDIYLFGGLGQDGPLADLWRFTLSG